MADKPTPSLADRRKAANLPVRSSTAKIAKMGRVTYLSAEPAKARNPQTGEMGDGFLTTVQAADGSKYQAFIGGVALCRELAAMNEVQGFPFSATLTRAGEGPGNPWQFAD